MGGDPNKMWSYVRREYLIVIRESKLDIKPSRKRNLISNAMME
jgi:hypothetical protein